MIDMALVGAGNLMDDATTESWIIMAIWGFPKIRGTFLGVPIIRTIVYWGLDWGTLILGNYHMKI